MLRFIKLRYFADLSTIFNRLVKFTAAFKCDISRGVVGLISGLLASKVNKNKTKNRNIIFTACRGSVNI